MPLKFAKPEPRKRVKARAQRAESVQAQKVRAACVERDGDCRLNDPSLWTVFGPCWGESEWAHLGDDKRFKTRGMAPEDRHRTPGTAMLCTAHHRVYDANIIDIQPTSSRGADGALAFKIGPTVYVEPPRKERD